MKLVLEDGTDFSGTSCGASRLTAGEVVFNTGMSGYIEAVTDPSYRGQILVLTYPLIGNYGVPDPRPHGSLALPYESSRIQIQGLVVQQLIDTYSHNSATRSFAEWLQEEQVPCISGVDTRALTRKLRGSGTMPGWLIPRDMDIEAGRPQCDVIDMADELFRLVAPSEVRVYPGGNPTILLIDVGAKDHIARSLLARGATVVRVPWFDDLTRYASEVDGIVIGNGPGDPQDLHELVARIRDIMCSTEIPIFGICLGHQLLALAAGGATYKLPYGHRSINQPVQDKLTGQCYITSQNHGYAVDDSSLTGDWAPWFINVNDGSNEGIRSNSGPFFSVQFHPESHPGPRDTEFLFDDFLRLVVASSRT